MIICRSRAPSSVLSVHLWKFCNCNGQQFINLLAAHFLQHHPALSHHPAQPPKAPKLSPQNHYNQTLQRNSKIPPNITKKTFDNFFSLHMHHYHNYKSHKITKIWFSLQNTITFTAFEYCITLFLYYN